MRIVCLLVGGRVGPHIITTSWCVSTPPPPRIEGGCFFFFFFFFTIVSGPLQVIIWSMNLLLVLYQTHVSKSTFQRTVHAYELFRLDRLRSPNLDPKRRFDHYQSIVRLLHASQLTRARGRTMRSWQMQIATNTLRSKIQVRMIDCAEQTEVRVSIRISCLCVCRPLPAGYGSWKKRRHPLRIL